MEEQKKTSSSKKTTTTKTTATKTNTKKSTTTSSKKKVAPKKVIDEESKKVEEIVVPAVESTPVVSDILEDNKAEVLAENSNEEKVDSPVEEEIAKPENEQVQEQAPVKPADVYVELHAPEFENCEEEIEKRRSEFTSNMKKGRNKSTLIMILLLLGLVGGFVMNNYLPTNLKWISYVVFGVIIVGIVVSFIFTSKDKKKIYGNVDEYVLNVILSIDSYAFANNSRLSDVKASKTAKISVDEIVKAHYFDTINAINSRNKVVATCFGKELSCIEVACRVPYQAPELAEGEQPVQNKKTPTESYGIFGKFISYPIALKNNAAVIITMKGTNFYKPTFLDGYSEIYIPSLNTAFTVYTTDNAVAEELFKNSEFVDNINSFSSDNVMENLFISINQLGLSVCLNYNESLMEIPMQRPVVGTPYVHFKDDIDKVIDLIEIIK